MHPLCLSILHLWYTLDPFTSGATLYRYCFLVNSDNLVYIDFVLNNVK